MTTTSDPRERAHEELLRVTGAAPVAPPVRQSETPPLVEPGSPAWYGREPEG